MRELLFRAERSLIVICALGLAAATGWASFAFSAWSSRQLSDQVSALNAERDEAVERFRRLERSAGELSQVEAKLNVARVEFNRAAQMWAAAQQELAVLSKRLEQTRERVSQTGSIRQAEPAKRPAR